MIGYQAVGKYLETFRKKLKLAFDSGQISKADLHRKTGISTSMIHRYLEGSEPGLHSLELIAEALNCDPRDLIKPEDEQEGQPTIPIQEHLSAVAALQQMLTRANELNEHHTKEIFELRKQIGTPTKLPSSQAIPKDILYHLENIDPKLQESAWEMIRTFVQPFTKNEMRDRKKG